MPPTNYPSGPALVDMSIMANGGGYNAVNGLVAKAGGGQATATLMPAAVNRITTVATLADSVVLPVGTGGQEITIINSGANACQVFGAVGTTDTINGTAGSTGISQAAGKAATYYSFYNTASQSLWLQLLSA